MKTVRWILVAIGIVCTFICIVMGKWGLAAFNFVVALGNIYYLNEEE